jgi:hypothetical protein
MICFFFPALMHLKPVRQSLFRTICYAIETFNTPAVVNVITKKVNARRFATQRTSAAPDAFIFVKSYSQKADF